MNRFSSFLGIGVMGLMIGLGSISMVACGDDDDDSPVTAGKAGAAGTAGKAGAGGASGGGSGGTAGTGTGGAGSGGTAGTGTGGGGAGGSAGASGTGGTAGARTEQFSLPGDKALTKCASSGKSVFETYGKLLPVGAGLIVDNTVVDLGKGGDAETKLGKSFAVLGTTGHLTVDQLKTSLGNFLIEAYGGPAGTYTGKDMFESHAGLAITKVQYDYFLNSIIVPTVLSATIPQADVDSCFAPALTDPKLINDIVEKK